MKKYIILATLIGITQFACASPYIVIGDRKLVRAFESPKNQLREYLPKGESLAHWSCLASVQVFTDETDPEKYLKRVADLVRKNSKDAVGQFFRTDQKKDTVLDFIIFSPKTAPYRFAEWTMMRAKFIEGTGLVVYQYGLRFYPSLTDNSPDVIKAERQKMIWPFVKASFEEQQEPNQSPEPTPTSGTSAAEQPRVPAVVVAHL